MKYVGVPEKFSAIFKEAEKIVHDFFQNINYRPSRGNIDICGERYILVRSASLSVDFFEMIQEIYTRNDITDEDTEAIASQILYNLAHSIGMKDAEDFQKKLNLKTPIEKLATGPVHFAHTGWAMVNIFPESTPSQDENYFLFFSHPYSFESEAWMDRKRKPKYNACIMNSGYSAGWCEQSFGMPLMTQEITCKALGDDSCQFIMAPPDKLEQHINKYLNSSPNLKKKLNKTTGSKHFEIRVLESKIKESEEKYRKIFNFAQDAIFVISKDNQKIIDCNAYATYIIGGDKETLIGSYFNRIFPSTHEYEKCLKKILNQFNSSSAKTFETMIVNNRGEQINVSVSANQYTIRGCSVINVILRNISEIIATREKLQFIAEHDQLTGLANRHLFFSFAKKFLAYAKRHKKKLSIMYIDIDQFKSFNDQYGHEVGDAVLKYTAERIKKNIREEDILARLGGDEFILLSTETKNKKEAASLTQKIIESVATPALIKDHKLQINLSIGIAIYPVNSKEGKLTDLINNADKALYRAKKKPGSKYEFF